MQLKDEGKNEQKLRVCEENDEIKNKPRQEATQSKADSLTKRKIQKVQRRNIGNEKESHSAEIADTKKKTEYSEQLYANKSEILMENEKFLKNCNETPLVIQWLRLHAPKARDPGSIPGQGTRSHMSQLKIPCATTKTWHKQINKYFLKKQRKI